MPMARPASAQLPAAAPASSVAEPGGSTLATGAGATGTISCDLKSFANSPLGSAAPLADLDGWDATRSRPGADKEAPIVRCGNRDSYHYVASVFRCPSGPNPLDGNLRAGAAARVGNVGPNHTGHIIDRYRVPCSDGEQFVFVDMYGCPRERKMLFNNPDPAQPEPETDQRPVPKQALDLYHQAQELHEQGQAQAALTLVQQALAVLSEQLGPKHPALGETLFFLGVLHAKLNDRKGAEAAFHRAYLVWEAAGWPAVPKAGDTAWVLSLSYGARGDGERAECLLQRALSVHERGQGSHSPAVAEILRELYTHYESSGELARAELVQRRLYYLTAFHLGAEDPECAIILMRLAVLYDRMKQPEKAAAVRQRAAQIRPARSQSNAGGV
jgi:hypothetical protein